MSGKTTTATSSCCGGDKEGDELASVHFMKCLSFLDAVDDALGCVCPQRAATESGENESDVDGLEVANSRTIAGEWFEAISF